MTKRIWSDGKTVVAYKGFRSGFNDDGKPWLELYTYGGDGKYAVMREDVEPIREVLSALKIGDSVELEWKDKPTSKYKVVKAVRKIQKPVQQVQFDIFSV